MRDPEPSWELHVVEESKPVVVVVPSSPCWLGQAVEYAGEGQVGAQQSVKGVYYHRKGCSCTVDEYWTKKEQAQPLDLDLRCSWQNETKTLTVEDGSENGRRCKAYAHGDLGITLAVGFEDDDESVDVVFEAGSTAWRNGMVKGSFVSSVLPQGGEAHAKPCESVVNALEERLSTLFSEWKESSYSEIKSTPPDDERLWAFVERETSRNMMRMADTNFSSPVEDWTSGDLLQTPPDLTTFNRNTQTNSKGKVVTDYLKPTTLTSDLWTFTSLAVAQLPEAGQTIYPSAALHFHTHPKWAWPKEGDHVISLRIRLSSGQMVRFYYQMQNNGFYAGILLVTALQVHKVYKPDVEGAVWNVVCTLV